MKTPLPQNEDLRIESLESYSILDSQREDSFDDITEMAAEITGCQAAFIGFIDQSRQWLKSTYRIPSHLVEIPREVSFCTHTILNKGPLIIEDTLANDTFKDYESVKKEPGIRFYCGLPIINKAGYPLGTLCVIDTKPNTILVKNIQHLEHFVDLILYQLELRKSLNHLYQLESEYETECQKYDSLLTSTLPESIAQELKQSKNVIPRYYESSTISFVNFQPVHGKSQDPIGEVKEINQFVTAFDEINEFHEIEKIKTIANTYMSVSGVPLKNRNHRFKVCLGALNLRNYFNKLTKQNNKLGLKTATFSAGIHTSSTIAGVVGKSKFTFDLWGDAVNITKRILENTEAGQISVSEQTAAKLFDYFLFENKRKIPAKNMNDIQVFSLARLQPKYSQDDHGLLPNKAFFESI